MLMPMYMNATISKEWKAKAVITIIRTIITNLRTAAHRICTYWTNIGIKRGIISISQKRFHLSNCLRKNIIKAIKNRNLKNIGVIDGSKYLYTVEYWLFKLNVQLFESLPTYYYLILWHKHIFLFFYYYYRKNW